jgi:hypothetical protein
MALPEDAAAVLEQFVHDGILFTFLNHDIC